MVKWLTHLAVNQTFVSSILIVRPIHLNLTPICDKKFGVFSLFIYTKVVSVNVLQVMKTRTIERPSYFFKYQGIKAFISSSVEFCLNLVNNILVNSTRLYLFTLAVC